MISHSAVVPCLCHLPSPLPSGRPRALRPCARPPPSRVLGRRACRAWSSRSVSARQPHGHPRRDSLLQQQRGCGVAGVVQASRPHTGLGQQRLPSLPVARGTYRSTVGLREDEVEVVPGRSSSQALCRPCSCPRRHADAAPQPSRARIHPQSPRRDQQVARGSAETRSRGGRALRRARPRSTPSSGRQEGQWLAPAQQERFGRFERLAMAPSVGDFDTITGPWHAGTVRWSSTERRPSGPSPSVLSLRREPAPAQNPI